MRIKKYFIIIVLLFQMQGLFAQAKNSVYSMFGVGQVYEGSFGINQSMGGTGIAFQSDVFLNYANPASYLGHAAHTYTLEGGVYALVNRASSSHASQTAMDGNLGYCSFALAFTKNWTAVIGLTPFSSVNYEIYTTDAVPGQLFSLDKQYVGSGGLSRIYAGNAFRLFPGLSVGFNTALIFGPIVSSEKALSTDSFEGYELKNNQFSHGAYIDYGLQYSFALGQSQYTLGFVYGPGKDLETTDELAFTYNGVTSLLEESNAYGLHIPQKWGAGIGMNQTRFRAGIDYEWKKWSDSDFSNPDLITKNSSRYSMGIEILSGRRSENRRATAFRAGAYLKTSYLEIDHTSIKAMGIAAGVGLPMKGAGNLNLSIEYGREGTQDNGLIQNTFWRFDLGFSVSEMWGRRTF